MTMITDRVHSRTGVKLNARAATFLVQTATLAERAVIALFAGLERARQRRELLSLGDRALQDFGASRCDAAREGDKPFWRR
jgi:uncharacterized protein YjiS (DUF1127 family)